MRTLVFHRRFWCLALLPLGLVLIDSCATSKGALFDARNCGATGDGKTLDTAAIQKAMDDCAQAGGGTVRLSPGAYLSGPLYLHGDHVTLEIQAGAVLQGTSGFDDYRNAKGQVVGLLNGNNMAEVTLCGSGVIDGGGAPWWPAVREAKRNNTPEPRRRPKMVNFKNCRNLTVRDVTLQNSPSFHLVPTDCENVLIDHVTIQAPSNSPNTDAIDPSACRDVRIVNCVLDVGDDNVAVKGGHSVAGRPYCCENIIVSNCICRAGHGLSIGSETSAGVSNFVVVNCTFDGTTSGIRIKSDRDRGGKVEHTVCRDLTMKNVTRPIDISCYYPRVPKEDPGQAVGARTPFFHDILIENLEGDCPQGNCLIVGLPESPVRDVTLSHVHLKTKTGLLIRNAQDVHLVDVKIEPRIGPPLIEQNATVQ